MTMMTTMIMIYANEDKESAIQKATNTNIITIMISIHYYFTTVTIYI